MRTGRAMVALSLAGGVLAAAVGWWEWHDGRADGSPRAATRAALMAASPESAASPAAQAPMPTAPGLPGPLVGTAVPRLPVDARGHLAVVRAVRDFFDYFLTARHAMSAKALDALVHRAIAAQFEGSPAQSEALDVWRRYTDYLHGLADVAEWQRPASAGGVDLDAAQAAFAERAAMASRTLGSAWSEAFFGSDWRHASYVLARLKIDRDGTLSDAQKAARLRALADMLPPEERAAAQREAKAQHDVAVAAALDAQASGASPDVLRAQATQALGAAVAARIVQMHEKESAWRARYADYVAQRARIDAMSLSPSDRENQRAKLRERMFADPGDRVRAASLDRAAD